MEDLEGEEPEEQVEDFEVFLAEHMKCIVLVDGLPKVDEAKFEKLQKHLKQNSNLVKTWGSPPKKVEMPMEGGKSLGFAFLEFDTPVCPCPSPAPAPAPAAGEAKTQPFRGPRHLLCRRRGLTRVRVVRRGRSKPRRRRATRTASSWTRATCCRRT